MSKKPFWTKSGEVLTDADIEELAEELGHGEIDFSKVRVTRRGRPLLGTTPPGVASITQ